MLGAILADFYCQTWAKTGAIPLENELPDTKLTEDIVQWLAVAKAIIDTEGTPDAEIADEAIYWASELLVNYAHDEFVSSSSDGTLDGWLWSIPIGEAAAGPGEAENETRSVADGEPALDTTEAVALAKAIRVAAGGADREAIAGCVLEMNLPDRSPLPYGAGALLKADSFDGAIEQALQHGFGRDAAICAGALAEPLFGLPDEASELALDSFSLDLRQIIEDFYEFVLTAKAQV